jgi:thioredoxin-related protein/tetratricopeptide (TPR) repeat protein
MKNIIILFVLLPILVIGQKANGVKFMHSVSNWNSIVLQAKKEKKFIFVDCYTSWCQPCKEVAHKIFPQKKVGDFFNKHFVSIALQLDTTKKDVARIIKAREIAKNLAKKYNVVSYPTFLIFDTNGSIVHKFSGVENADALIVNTKNGLNIETQLYNLILKYNLGNRDGNFLKKICKAAQIANENVDVYFKTFIENSENLYTIENGFFIIQFMEDIGNLAFKTFYANKEKWSSVLGKQKVDEELERTICCNLEIKLLFMDQNKINWQDLTNEYTKEFPEFGNVVIAKEKMYRKFRNKEYVEFIKMIDSLSIIYPSQMNYPSELNGNAICVFSFSNNPTLLKKALSWSQQSIDQDKNNATFLDTYANLLYKLGQTKEAIEIETKAIEIVEEKYSKSYIDVLNKMKKGKPTWKKQNNESF